MLEGQKRNNGGIDKEPGISTRVQEISRQQTRFILTICYDV
jgi:hypothetical protein